MATVSAVLDGETFQGVQFIRYRNPSLLAAVVTQTFIVLAAGLVIIGILYVMFVITLITIHHYCHDREAEHIPDYVKNSMQFSSDEDTDYDDEEMRALSAFQLRRASTKSGTQIIFNDGPTNSRKTLLLDRFLNDYNDRQRNIKN